MAAAQAAKGGTNWFAVVISTIVVVALVGVGALVIWLNNRASAPGVAPTGAIINTETGAISFGEGADAIGTYVDFLCPHCASFEQQYGQTLAAAASDDTITLDVFPVAIMNHAAQGTNFSSRAAGAMYCVAEEAPESALDFMQTLFANQSAALSLSDDDIVTIASQVGAGAAEACIVERTYVKFADDMTANMPANPSTGSRGTPTVTIDGEYTELSEVSARFADILG